MRSVLFRARGTVLTVLTGVLLAMFMVPGAASAATGDLVCPQSHGVVTFTPALSASNPSVSATFQLGDGPTPCYSPNGRFSNLATTWTGTQTRGITASLSPTGGAGICGQTFIVNQGPPGLPYNWANGQPESVIEGTISTDPTNQPGGPAHLVLNVRIVEGPMTGDYAAAVLVASVNPDCATAGLKTLTVADAVVSYG